MREKLKIKNGDVVLISNLSINGIKVQKLQNSEWDQVGLIYYNSTLKHFSLFFSTGFPVVEDETSGKLVEGVQTVQFETFLKENYKKIAIRKLIYPLDEIQIRKYKKFINKTLGIPFEFSSIRTIKALLRKNDYKKMDKFFCSHVVAETYKYIGLINSSQNSQLSCNYIPRDFSRKDEQIDWITCNKLGKETYII